MKIVFTILAFLGFLFLNISTASLASFLAYSFDDIDIKFVFIFSLILSVFQTIMMIYFKRKKNG